MQIEKLKKLSRHVIFCGIYCWACTFLNFYLLLVRKIKVRLLSRKWPSVVLKVKEFSINWMIWTLTGKFMWLLKFIHINWPYHWHSNSPQLSTFSYNSNGVCLLNNKPFGNQFLNTITSFNLYLPFYAYCNKWRNLVLITSRNQKVEKLKEVQYFKNKKKKNAVQPNNHL